MGDAMIVPDGLGEVVAGVVLALEGTGADQSVRNATVARDIAVGDQRRVRRPESSWATRSSRCSQLGVASSSLVISLRGLREESEQVGGGRRRVLALLLFRFFQFVPVGLPATSPGRCRRRCAPTPARCPEDSRNAFRPGVRSRPVARAPASVRQGILHGATPRRRERGAPTPLGSGTYSCAFEATRLLVSAGPILLSQYSSGVTSPETTAWPRPQLALMAMSERVAGARTDREGDPRDVSVGHQLHGHRNLRCLRRLGHAEARAVGNGLGGVQARPAFAHLRDDLVGPDDPEVRLLLARQNSRRRRPRRSKRSEPRRSRSGSPVPRRRAVSRESSR